MITASLLFHCKYATFTFGHGEGDRPAATECRNGEFATLYGSSEPLFRN